MQIQYTPLAKALRKADKLFQWGCLQFETALKNEIVILHLVSPISTLFYILWRQKILTGRTSPFTSKCIRRPETLSTSVSCSCLDTSVQGRFVTSIHPLSLYFSNTYCSALLRCKHQHGAKCMLFWWLLKGIIIMIGSSYGQAVDIRIQLSLTKIHLSEQHYCLLLKRLNQFSP